MRRAVQQAAVTALLLACTALPSVAQIDPRTALLERAGWDALAAGRVHAADRAFRDALTSDPRNPRLHLGAGITAYMERRDTDARVELERTLSLAPGLVEARKVLGYVQYRGGDLPAAIASLEAVVAAAPQATALQATLARWRREAALHDRLRQVLGNSFTVSFDGPSEEALATRVLASLDRAYWRVGALLGTFPSQPIPVVIYTREEFADIMQAPEWAVGAYDGTIRLPMRRALEDPAELERVLAHELAHALVHVLATRNVPAWLDEGLATALESDDLSWAERCVRAAPAPVPLQALPASFSRLSGDQARLAYATSALAVRQLLDTAGGDAVASLLRDLGEGVDLEPAFLHWMQRPLADLQSDGSAGLASFK